MTGLIIKESLSDESVLDLISINKTEIWKAENHTINQPKYWTAISFSTNDESFVEKLSKVLKNNEWYVDLSTEYEKILVFKDNVFRYRLGDSAGKQNAVNFCRKIGISESQIDWKEQN